MTDWYTTARAALMDDLVDIVVDNSDPEQVATALYGFLSEIGLVDYDIEKEVLYARYIAEGEDGDD